MPKVGNTNKEKKWCLCKTFFFFLQDLSVSVALHLDKDWANIQDNTKITDLSFEPGLFTLWIPAKIDNKSP